MPHKVELPICTHCGKPINKRRLASDTCMCEWKGVPSKVDRGKGRKICGNCRKHLTDDCPYLLRGQTYNDIMQWCFKEAK